MEKKQKQLVKHHDEHSTIKKAINNLYVIRGPCKSFLTPNDRRNLHRRNSLYMEIYCLGLTLTQVKRKNGMTMQYITHAHRQQIASSHLNPASCRILDVKINMVERSKINFQ